MGKAQGNMPQRCYAERCCVTLCRRLQNLWCERPRQMMAQPMSVATPGALLGSQRRSHKSKSFLKDSIKAPCACRDMGHIMLECYFIGGRRERRISS